MMTYTGSMHWLEDQCDFWTRSRVITALCLLLGMFAFRVISQFMQLIGEYSWLPEFDSWHSGVLPYPVLLASQIALMGLATTIIVGLVRGDHLAPRYRGAALCLIGRVYLYGMLIRLLLGITILSDHHWFGSTLPTLFHVVLASFVIVLGNYERSQTVNRAATFRWYLSHAMATAWYPAIIAGALLLHFIMTSGDGPLVLSTYLPVVLAALAIGLLEVYFPYRACWRANRREALQDSIFMILVQGVLPLGLTFLAATIILESTGFHARFWPHHWPVAGQAVLMLVLADFARYWMHRAFHSFRPLWQIHAVHHAPHKLYWLNVARFHPLEKAMQFLLDALPFIVVGVDSAVLSLYFVFYACNGFFQHSNIHVKLGWLNYLISGPELHRWHHSVNKRESDRNFGNNLIIWDLIFGTRYLPGKGSVGPVGLVNRDYPSSFLAQLRTPFIQGMDSHGLPLLKLGEIGVNFLLQAQLAATQLKKGLGYLLAVRQPQASQQNVLQRILRENAGTTFGTHHGFSSIQSYDDYVSKVPIQDWDALAPYSRAGGNGCSGLTAEQPCFFQVTSGTTGSAKHLPQIRRGIKADQYLQGLNIRSYRNERADAFTGKIFAIVSPAIEGISCEGIPYGSASGVIYQNMPAMARSKYVLPYSVFEIDNYPTRNLMIALMALAEPGVTIAVTANPSTFVLLRDIIDQHLDTLLQALETGKIERVDLSADQHRDIEAKIANRGARANELREIRNASGKLDYADFWPDLKLVNTWTGGSCGIALSSLLPGLPADAQVVELGYLASEVRATISLGQTPGVPTLRDTFFEFIERECWEVGDKQTLLLHELEPNRQYYVLITTVNGLYRYFMNDIVEVAGKFYNTPTLKFLQKGRGVTNITGEKLYECQTLEAIRQLEKEFGLAVSFHQWMADEADSLYRVYLEVTGNADPCPAGFSESLDSKLKNLNVEYDTKRRSGRLSAPVVKLLKEGTSREFRSHYVRQGQREAQFKALTLIYQRDSTFPLDTMVLQ